MDSRDFVVKNMTNKIIKMLEVSKGNIENIINSLPNIVAIVKYNGWRQQVARPRVSRRAPRADGYLISSDDCRYLQES